MKGDIAIAGFMITAEEWQSLDVRARAQLVAVITRREDGGWSAVAASDSISEPARAPDFGLRTAEP
jgi:hypothetical protein